MPRSSHLRTAAPRVGMLVAACVMLWCAGAMAQTPAPLFQSPLAPLPESGDMKNPPQRFQKVQQQQQLGQPQRFMPASGAGKTGFDSTNARKRSAAGKPAPYSAAPSNAAAGASTPAAISPPTSAKSAYAAAGQPGQPPVELGPIRKPPKKRKPEEDPYAPLGIRAGSFLLYPAIEVIGGHDSNPGHSSPAKGAWLYTVAPEIQVKSDWTNHELKADLRGSYTGYTPDETPTLSRPYFNGKIDGRIDVTRDTNILLGTRMLVSTDNPGSPNLQAGLAKLPIYTTVGGTAGAVQRFNRLEVTVKGDAERTEYQNSTLTDGSIASNKDRNYNQYGGTARVAYELTPGVKPFVEGGGDTRQHDLATDLSGFQRDSNGVVGKAGSTFEISRLLTGEIAAGYLQRDYADPRLAKLEGFIGQGSLTWTASALTTAKLSVSSSAGESTVPGVSGVLYRDVGLQVDHALRQWLIFTAKAGFGYDDYVGILRRDKRFSLGAGLTYKINREVSIKGEFRQDWLRSNSIGNDYTASVFLLGLRLQR
ncbi:MAG: outer membrane beta-barrel protein [Pseudolabrys sp.]